MSSTEIDGDICKLASDTRTTRVDYKGNSYMVKTMDVVEAKKEIEILKRLQDTGLAPELLYVCTEIPEKVSIIMEYIAGDTLQDYSTPTVKSKAKVLMDIVLGLTVMFNEGIIYPDIHDLNILVDKEGNVHFIDFGSCSTMDKAMAQRVAKSKGPMIIYQRLLPVLNSIVGNNKVLGEIVSELGSTKNIQAYMEKLQDIVDD